MSIIGVALIALALYVFVRGAPTITRPSTSTYAPHNDDDNDGNEDVKDGSIVTMEMESVRQVTPTEVSSTSSPGANMKGPDQCGLSIYHSY